MKDGSRRTSSTTDGSREGVVDRAVGVSWHWCFGWHAQETSGLS